MALGEMNRFVESKSGINIQRSTMRIPQNVKTTLNSGKIVPVFLKECLPADTVKIDMSSVIRQITPAVPVMDNSFIDFYAFYAPFRILTKNPTDWQEINGENTKGFWTQDKEYTLQNTGNDFLLNFEDDDFNPNTFIRRDWLWNYMPGFHFSGAFPNLDQPTGVFNERISRLPVNMYLSIYNEWFRDENTQNPIDWKTYDDADYRKQVLCDANKLHDVFTSALPAPQKGVSVLIPLLGTAPVIANSLVLQGSSGTYDASRRPVYQLPTPGAPVESAGALASLTSVDGTVRDFKWDIHTVPGVDTSEFYADLAEATGATVNQLRLAFAMQRVLEKDARGGTRFNEFLRVHFGVSIMDETIQRVQYIAGKRQPLNITTVLQTSATQTGGFDNVLGQTGAMGHTSFRDLSIVPTISVKEHGYLMIVACVRTRQTYFQGLDKLYTKQRKFDWYLPALAHIGEQGIKKKELFFQANKRINDQVFGYQEAWYEYRYFPDELKGYFEPQHGDKLLPKWDYAIPFNASPVISGDFLKQKRDNIDKTLAYASSNYQFILDLYFNGVWTRPMPVFSYPGLIDHF